MSETVRATKPGVDETYAARVQEDHSAAISALNRAAHQASLNMHLLPFDLEYALTSNVADARAVDLGIAVNLRSHTGEELAHRLGSQCRVERAKGFSKADAIRREIWLDDVPGRTCTPNSDSRSNVG